MNNFTLDIKQEALVNTGTGAKIRTFRREQSKFFIEFDQWMKNANVGVVTAFAQSESNGWITLTLCYYERQDPDIISVDPSLEVLSKACIAINDALYLVDAIAKRLDLLPPKTLPDLAPREADVDSNPQYPG